MVQPVTASDCDQLVREYDRISRAQSEHLVRNGRLVESHQTCIANGPTEGAYRIVQETPLEGARVFSSEMYQWWADREICYAVSDDSTGNVRVVCQALQYQKGSAALKDGNAASGYVCLTQRPATRTSGALATGYRVFSAATMAHAAAQICYHHDLAVPAKK